MPMAIAEDILSGQIGTDVVGCLRPAAKNGALLTAADLLAERAGEIRAANDADLAAARAAGMADGPLDRLRLTDARLESMANGLRTVAAWASAELAAT